MGVYSEVKKMFMHAQDAVVCTIVSSEGSSPRKAGASMAVSPSGRCFGTIGGGDLEKFCIQKALEVHADKKSFVREFKLNEKEKDDVAMICGGNVTVSFTYLDCRKVSDDELKEIFHEEEVRPQVYIFGGGHVAKELVPVLEHVGFDVTVTDNRPEFASKERHPKAKKVILGDYTDIGALVDIKDEDYVVIMTHGHAFDRDVLLQACRTGAKYVGCIGSRRKVAMTQQYLRENGISEKRISEVHAPIGIELYGDTPEEIAISIAAEMIRFRYQPE
ncbi:MAG: xanthine dehydrogenase accessory protein XdhC [Sphaerochaetaceae bacterium]|nr:xanthine dehydrogenase accessory protein XdhC [Sphaerochaetaceae bacterium]